MCVIVNCNSTHVLFFQMNDLQMRSGWTIWGFYFALCQEVQSLCLGPFRSKLVPSSFRAPGPSTFWWVPSYVIFACFLFSTSFGLNSRSSFGRWGYTVEFNRHFLFGLSANGCRVIGVLLESPVTISFFFFYLALPFFFRQTFRMLAAVSSYILAPQTAPKVMHYDCSPQKGSDFD